MRAGATRRDLELHMIKQITGFTFTELFVVLLTIGLIAAIVVPRFASASTPNPVVAAGDDIIEIARAVEYYNASKGTWPSETDTGVLPPELAMTFRSENPFAQPCPIGSRYDYDYITINKSNAILISLLPDASAPAPTITDAQALDAYLDDGVLSTGRFQASGSGYAYRVNLAK